MGHPSRSVHLRLCGWYIRQHERARHERCDMWLTFVGGDDECIVRDEVGHILCMNVISIPLVVFSGQCSLCCVWFETRLWRCAL